jgi:NADH-quinone oxidoreductase subunit I
MCCPTVCPAHCITIIPEESDSKGIEKRPAVFEIDELRCVVCGLCAEACPCDAIRMDTLDHAKPVYRRGDAILDREELLERGVASTAVQGGVGAFWREKVEGEAQTPPDGAVLPGGPPAGPTPIETFAPRSK